MCLQHTPTSDSFIYFALKQFFPISFQNIASEITLCDVQKDKLMGEVMDLQHGVAFTRHGVAVNASLGRLNIKKDTLS